MNTEKISLAENDGSFIFIQNIKWWNQKHKISNKIGILFFILISRYLHFYSSDCQHFLRFFSFDKIMYSLLTCVDKFLYKNGVYSMEILINFNYELLSSKWALNGMPKHKQHEMKITMLIMKINRNYQLENWFFRRWKKKRLLQFSFIIEKCESFCMNWICSRIHNSIMH